MQRKRHINFKDFIARLLGSRKSKLHSIPILLNMKKSTSQNTDDNDTNDCRHSEKNKVKSNVLYSISCVRSCAYSFCGAKFKSISMVLFIGIMGLVGLMGEEKCSAATSVSLSVSQANLSTNAVQNSTSYVSSTVSVKASNIEDYSLNISGPTNLTGATTITGAGGKIGSSMGDNTWGYSWSDTGSADVNLTYNSLSPTGVAITDKPAVSNYGVEFTKKLTFAAKFGDKAEGGHYTANVNLKLVATPRTIGIWTLADGSTKSSGISTMQSMASDICSQVATPASGSTAVPTMTLLDSRDGSYYSIAKYPDGKCWMQENLRITGTIHASESDFTSPASLILPNSTSGFSDNTIEQLNAFVKDGIGYYNWYTATAQTGTSSVTSGSVNSSICPNGWKLPTGGTSGNTDFYNLFKNMGLSVSSTLATSSFTTWTADDLSKAQSLPYNFTYHGYLVSGNFYEPPIYRNGTWWSSTADYDRAYALGISDSQVTPGISNPGRSSGYSIRCVADVPEPKTYSITYYPNNPRFGGTASTETCTTYDNTCTINKQNPTSVCTNHTFLGWSTNQNATSPTYSFGDQITMSSDLTLYGVWNGSGNICAS